MTIGLVELGRFQNIQYPSNVIDVYSEIQQVPPNYITGQDNIFYEKETQILNLPVNLQLYGLTRLFLNNHGEIIIQIAIYLMLAVLAILANRFLIRHPKQDENISSKIKLWKVIFKFFVWNFVFMIMISTYPEGASYFWLQISYPSMTYSPIPYLVGFVFMIFILLWPLHMFLIIKTCVQIIKE